MYINLLTAEDHILFLNYLKNIFNSGKEYSILLTNKNGNNKAEYFEMNPDTHIEKLVHRHISQSKNGKELGHYFQKSVDTNEKYKVEPEKVRLTQREVEVITLVANEYTTKEIADKLFLSTHTVESHRKNLIAKLNVRNLAGLTKYALRMGYTDLTMLYEN